MLVYNAEIVVFLWRIGIPLGEYLLTTAGIILPFARDRSQRGRLMKRFVAFAAALFVASSIPMLLAQTTTTATSNDQEAERELRQLNDDEVHAFLQRDPDAMTRLWSDDFVVTNPLNKFINKQAVLEMVRSGFLVITPYTRNIEYVRIYGDTAVVAGSEVVVWGGKMPNAGKQEHLRFTGIWLKQGGRWREIARHANIVPEQ